MFDSFAALLIANDVEPFEVDIDSYAAEFCSVQSDATDPELFRDRFLMYLAGT